MRLRLFLVAAALSVVPGWRCTLAKEKPFPRQILTAKTIAVVAHYGFSPSAFDPAKGVKFKNDAENVLRISGRFTLLDDPAKSDLVLLLVSGYSPGKLGFREHIVTGAIFLGGTQPGWTPVPLWISEKTSGLRSSSGTALTKMLLNEIKKAEQRGGNPSTAQQETGPEETKPQETQKEEIAPSPEDGEVQPLPREILQAKKVMVMLRIDSVAGPQGEEKEKSIEKEIKKWGRYTLVDNPADADLLFVGVLFMEPGGLRPYDFHTFENLLIFKAGAKNPDWNTMPLWTAMQVEALFWPSPGTQMIRWLRKQMERQEARPIPPVPAPPRP